MTLILIVEGIARRFSGPGGFRLIIQPIVAIALGVRAGLIDSKQGEPPYLIALLYHPQRRQALLSNTAKHILKPFTAGVLIDLILQYFIFQRVRIVAALIVGLLLIGLPYSIARGVSNRITTTRRRRRTD
jgi:hypothetical protein